MLIPLTRDKFDQLMPLLATGPQYSYYSGKFADVLNRLLISIVWVLIVAFLLSIFLGNNLVTFCLGAIGGLYFLWAPIYFASLRNFSCRRHRYSGFWQGEVLDLYISEELVGTEQTVNKKGQLVVVENRQRRLNLEIGDETGFTTELQVPLQREHKLIRPGEIAQMLVMSDRADLGRIAKISDIYIPRENIWVSDYPYVRRDVFAEVSDRLNRRRGNRSNKRRPPRY
ncbi:phosphate ABC transporter permease [Merismopedia glauca]|uniref:Phosphate ABC transporter permease n=1 Tax=Merismopedia glauca CCAP 1448/3 TaxID=1296344 RepID=A0A2T1BZA2_9CYAN|nr:phosphate ABC transporter permease [Merismopedia glauca]PSB01203.1 phosphate ABC transporter permease [Merismopedia glauca CCAP 1448/3]